MSFDGRHVALAGLIELALPSETVRFADGGFIVWDGETWRDRHATFGTIGGAEAIEEAGGDEAPGMVLTLNVPSATAAGIVSAPEAQDSPVRFRLVRFDPETGEPVPGADEMVADMVLDRTVLRFGRGARTVELGLVSAADRLFQVNEGNVLSDAFHQRVWPGEDGFANAVEVGMTVAWGVAGAPRGSVVGGSGGGGGGGGGRFEYSEALR
jgi:hypothetical protein